MSFLTPDFVIASTLKVGVVYKIVAPEFISTSEPHYFVVVAINNDDNYMLLSTTQLDRKIEYCKKRGFDLDTLAFIEPSKGNGLTENSYFNCNDYFTITKGQLIIKVKEGKLTPQGNFNENEYKKLYDSISLSTVNDIPKFLLKFEEK